MRVRSVARRRPAERDGIVELVARLTARLPEIEGAVLTRVYALADPTEVSDPAYVSGLRAAVSAGIAYAIAAIEQGESRPAPIPTELLGQARFAARNGVSLDTVLRRYLAGQIVLADFLDEEAVEPCSPSPSTLRRLRRGQGALLDRLLAAVAEEYGRESRALSSPAGRRLALVRRLLRGELIDTADLAYEFDGWHLALVATGRGPEPFVRELAAAADRRLLVGETGPQIACAWLGGRCATPSATVLQLARSHLPDGVRVAFGESAQGIEGWRLSHRQAAAALEVARRGSEPLVRYADVSLLASALCDEVLSASLRRLFLAPLGEGPEGGATLRETLRAYFDAERNSASAAAALGVTRQTVNNRLRSTEERLGTSLQACAAELELALRIESLKAP